MKRWHVIAGGWLLLIGWPIMAHAQQHHLEILQGEIDQLLRDTNAIRASLKAKRCQ